MHINTQEVRKETHHGSLFSVYILTKNLAVHKVTEMNYIRLNLVNYRNTSMHLPSIEKTSSMQGLTKWLIDLKHDSSTELTD